MLPPCFPTFVASRRSVFALPTADQSDDVAAHADAMRAGLDEMDDCSTTRVQKYAGFESNELQPMSPQRSRRAKLRFVDQRTAVKNWLRGQAAAEEMQKRLLAAEGPQPEQAMAEALSALTLLEEMGLWPGPRDTLAEREVEEVRRRWAKIQKRCRARALRKAAAR